MNFEGINSKVDIYLNEIKLGTLDGFMESGKFDITNIIYKGAANVLVVLVYLPEEPLVNWASPTYMTSAGWDWTPYVPGLNMGITDDVYISASNEVTFIDPWIRTTEILSPNSAKNYLLQQISKTIQEISQQESRISNGMALTAQIIKCSRFICCRYYIEWKKMVFIRQESIKLN